VRVRARVMADDLNRRGHVSDTARWLALA
jgi:hypothetical protein